jgi:hypothetical protein
MQIFQALEDLHGCRTGASRSKPCLPPISEPTGCQVDAIRSVTVTRPTGATDESQYGVKPRGPRPQNGLRALKGRTNPTACCHRAPRCGGGGHKMVVPSNASGLQAQSFNPESEIFKLPP